MAVLHDLECRNCGLIDEDWVENGAIPNCRCGAPRTKIYLQMPVIDAWGGPQYHPGLDRTFDSKSELRSYMRERGLVEAGDKVGGARNEESLRLGKVYDYPGKRRNRGGAREPQHPDYGTAGVPKK